MGYLITFGVIIIILLVLWAWINVKMLRKPEPTTYVGTDHDVESPARSGRENDEGKSFSDAIAPTAALAMAENVTNKVVSEKVDVAEEEPVAVESVEENASGDTVENTLVAVKDSVAVEVVHMKNAKTGIFDRPVRPFQLYDVRVPDFASDAWQQLFYRLTDDAKVVGWIAFQDETVGACDREYDQPFLDTLRNYQRTVSKLQKEVGISRLSETSIVGEEGKIWFVTVVDHAWIAMFMDKATSTEGILDGLLPKLRTTEE